MNRPLEQDVCAVDSAESPRSKTRGKTLWLFAVAAAVSLMYALTLTLPAYAQENNEVEGNGVNPAQNSVLPSGEGVTPSTVSSPTNPPAAAGGPTDTTLSTVPSTSTTQTNPPATTPTTPAPTNNGVGTGAPAGEGANANNALLQTPAGNAGTPVVTGANDEANNESITTTNEPAPAVPEGSAYVQGAEDAVYENTDSANAIQQAIDAALKNADGNSVKSYTVVVNNGTYTGGLTITKYYTVVNEDGRVETRTYTLPEDFVLYITYVGVVGQTDDARAEGDAGAVLQGDIAIDGVNTSIAGLHVADRNDVAVSNANSFEFCGTKEDDDLVVTLAGVKNATIVTGAGNDVLTVKGAAGGAGAASNGAVALRGGAGDDLLTVDASLHSTADSVTVAGGDGSDMLHLTGALATENGAGKIAGSDTNLNLYAAGVAKSTALALAISGVEAYTDALTGKTTVTLTLTNGAGTFENTAFQSFTDYVVNADRILYLSITGTGNTFLSNLRLNASQIFYVYAPMLNVLVQAKGITVGDDATVTAESLGLAEGESLGITARNIRLEAFDTEDAKLEVPLDEIPYVGTALGLDDLEINFSLFDATARAFVRIGADAVLDATQTIYLSAITVQRGAVDAGLINDKDGWLNSIVVKVGSASVTVLGELHAGGNIVAEAHGIMDVVADSSDLSNIGGTNLVPLNFPLAVVVGVLDTDVVFDGAIVNAGASFFARALSDVSLTAVSTTGALIPVSLAVAVGVIDTNALIQGGSEVTAKHDVQLLAKSILSSQASSTLPADGDASRGSAGFFVVNVAQNSAKAAITGSEVAAEGNVDVVAEARNTVGSSTAVILLSGFADNAKALSLLQAIRLVPELLKTAVVALESVFTGDFKGAGNKITGACQLIYDATVVEEDNSSAVNKILDTALQVAAVGSAILNLPSANQLVGALAVTVSDADAQALLGSGADAQTTLGSGANVTAGGVVNVASRGFTNARTIADATPVTTAQAVNSLGVAVSVAVINHAAKARVADDTQVKGRRFGRACQEPARSF